MDFDTSWDVEKYKSPFECDEHWELRRNFLLAHKDKYPEDRLVCLAQVFFNLELLGCRYPKKTMDLIAELSEGIADSFRQKKQQKIQRTFVKASDAAGARLKGLSRGPTSVSSNSTVDACTNKLKTHKLTTSNTYSKIDSSLDPTKGIISVFVDNFDTIFPGVSPFQNIVLLKTVSENFFDDGFSILHRSFTKKQIRLIYSFERAGETWKCDIIICGKTVVSAIATQKQHSKKAACESLLNSLQDICFTLEEKQKILSDGTEVGKNVAGVARAEPKLSDDSVGSKIMKLMGWKGGGLGKTEQGRSEPVTAAQDHVRRTGLGVNLTTHELMQKLNTKLRTFAEAETDYDLVFSSDFTKEERAKLHAIARKYHLKTHSYGSGNDRHLVVSKRRKNDQSIVQTLIDCGGENERYRLIPPFKMD